MRADVSVANGDTPLTALMRETAAATVDTVLAELRRRPPRTKRRLLVDVAISF